MPEFTIRNLSCLAYAQGFTLWHYWHRGPLGEALGENFFRPAHERFEGGDMILVSANDGGAHVFVHRTDPNEGVYLEPMASTCGASR